MLNFDLIEASFIQDYQIDLRDSDWLDNNSAKKFQTLINGLTEYTALGQAIKAKALKKQNPSNAHSESIRFDTTNENGANLLQAWAKGFQKKEG